MFVQKIKKHSKIKYNETILHAVFLWPVNIGIDKFFGRYFFIILPVEKIIC